MTTTLGQPTSGVRHDLDVVACPASIQVIEITTIRGEVSALCPVVDRLQPDAYELHIRYQPDGQAVEAKSLKEYLASFRGRRLLAEELADEVARMIGSATGCRWVEVTAEQNPRGGQVLAPTARVEAAG